MGNPAEGAGGKTPRQEIVLSPELEPQYKAALAQLRGIRGLVENNALNLKKATHSNPIELVLGPFSLDLLRALGSSEELHSLNNFLGGVKDNGKMKLFGDIYYCSLSPHEELAKRGRGNADVITLQIRPLGGKA